VSVLGGVILHYNTTPVKTVGFTHLQDSNMLRQTHALLASPLSSNTFAAEPGYTLLTPRGVVDHRHRPAGIPLCPYL
jgi:hypothetical protein